MWASLKLAALKWNQESTRTISFIQCLDDDDLSYPNGSRYTMTGQALRTVISYLNLPAPGRLQGTANEECWSWVVGLRKSVTNAQEQDSKLPPPFTPCPQPLYSKIKLLIG